MLLLEQKVDTVLIVGGGRVAARKATKLLDNCASVTLIAPKILPEIQNLSAAKTLLIKEREFKDTDIDVQDLVVAATSSKSLNIHISKLCRTKRISVNVVDNPDLSTVYFPAVFKKGGLSVGVATFGAAPGFAKMMKENLSGLVSESDIELLNKYTAARNTIDKDLICLSDSFKGALERKKTGKLFFVGAGPGDPELITIKGKKAIETADLILYDGLVSSELLMLRGSGSKLIDVSKRKGEHGIIQKQINKLMIKSVKEGLNVCRLKGGDPAIFGRLDEEIAALKKENLEFEIIPGVTAACAAAAETGKSLTSRKNSHKLVILTGNTAKNDIPKIFEPSGTVIFYMGLTHLREITAQLIKEGVSEDSEVFVISRASLPGNCRISANLGKIDSAVKNSSLTPELPALIIVFIKNRERDLSDY